MKEARDLDDAVGSLTERDLAAIVDLSIEIARIIRPHTTMIMRVAERLADPIAACATRLALRLLRPDPKAAMSRECERLLAAAPRTSTLVRAIIHTATTSELS